jgi:hypothetical protein
LYRRRRRRYSNEIGIFVVVGIGIIFVVVGIIFVIVDTSVRLLDIVIQLAIVAR